MKPLDIFCVTVPGLEPLLAEEALALGLSGATPVKGGVTFAGHWNAIWRANLRLRGATRVLVRIGKFRVFHLDELERLAMDFPWEDTFRPDVPLKIEVTSKASKVDNTEAITQRIAKALQATVGVTVSDSAAITLRVRIDNNLCLLSVDTSGDPLHIRGHKQFIGKAPMRESFGSLILRHCGYDGTRPLVDPIETDDTNLRFYGSDRDAGAVKGAGENAERAGVADIITFKHHAISDLPRPDGPPGLVMVNPPYGGRIGNKRDLFALYGALGKTLTQNFAGWKVGLVTSEPSLAKSTALPWVKDRLTFDHGGMKVSIYQTGPLAGAS